MLLSLDVEQFNNQCIFITDSIRNTVIDNSSFIRIIYSNNNVILNGIVIRIPFKDFQINKYFNKWRCNFSINENEELVNRINNIERQILEKVDVTDKQSCYRIKEQLENGHIKTFVEEYVNDTFFHNNVDILLKISGIWVSEKEYGITYKFILTH